MNPLRDHLLSELAWARRCTEDVLKDWPEDRTLFRTGESDNHLTWTLGHLALSDEWILTMLTGEKSPLPEHYGKLFGYQSTVQDDPSVYPSMDEVRGHFQASRARLRAWMEAATDEQLAGPLDDGGVGFASTPREALSKEAWHEGWHAGQLAPLRRALGLKPAFDEGQ
jgi:uncharacterized damage-inducible protein DinB